MPQIPSLSLLEESLQNSLINHKNQRWKLGHFARVSYARCEFVPHVALLSALSQQLLNDSSGEASPDSPGRLWHSPAHLGGTTVYFPPTHPHPLHPALPLSDFNLFLSPSDSSKICSWCYLNYHPAKIVAQETFFCLSCNPTVVCCYF